MPDAAGYAQSLRDCDAIEQFPSLAATALALIPAAAAPGGLIVAHCIAVRLHSRFGDEPLDEADWRAIRAIMGLLADLIDRFDSSALDAVARAVWNLSDKPVLQ